MSETPTQAPAPTAGAGLSIAGLVLGGVAVVAGIIPIFGIGLVWVPAILALVFGVIGVSTNRPKKVLGYIAIGLAVVSVVLAFVMFRAGVEAAAKTALNAAGDSATEALEDLSEEATKTETSDVVYEISGDGTATVTYAKLDGGNYSASTASNAALPWTNSGTVERNALFNLSSLVLSAVGSYDTTTLSCKITVDGEVIAENTATGSFAAVTCSDLGLN